MQLKRLFFENSKNTPNMTVVFDVIKNFFEVDYKPSKKEWFISIYLAYSMALKRKMNYRIAPAILFSTHPITKSVPISKYYDLFRGFKYLYGIEIIRRPSICLGSRCDNVLSLPKHAQHKNYKSFFGNWSFMLKNFLGEIGTDYSEWAGSAFSNENHEFLSSRRLVRFEDLKNYPQATLAAMINFFDLPYDDMLMRTTENGVEVGSTLRGPGTTVKGYDVASVNNLHEKGLSKFDHFRIEVLLGNRYDVYGYKPLFWGGEKYTKEDIIKLFEIPFKFEWHFKQVDPSGVTVENRKVLMDLVKSVLSVSYGTAINGRKYVMIPLIKPKEELLTKEQYK